MIHIDPNIKTFWLMACLLDLNGVLPQLIGQSLPTTLKK